MEPGGGEVFKEDARVFDDVGIVVKLKGDLKAIGIGDQAEGYHKAGGKKVPVRKGPSLDWSLGGNGLGAARSLHLFFL